MRLDTILTDYLKGRQLSSADLAQGFKATRRVASVAARRVLAPPLLLRGDEDEDDSFRGRAGPRAQGQGQQGNATILVTVSNLHRNAPQKFKYRANNGKVEKCILANSRIGWNR